MALTDLLSQPFMVRALLAGALLGAILAALGAFATLRRMAFFGEGIAHASLAGIAVAVLAGIAPLPVALLWGIGVACAIFVLERTTKLPSDSAIGILFTASMALGIILMSFTQGYQPELLTYLFGSILGVTWQDVIILAAALVVLCAVLAAAYRPIVLAILNDETARVHGIATGRVTLLLYVMLAIGVVLGVKMLGIILVSALLIIPTAAARLLAGSMRQYLALSIIIAEAAVVVGIVVSAAGNRPTGACIVLAAALLFLLASVVGARR
ncbi:metal ABC transporter permease [Candidatus Uhrbacteria bacterium]|nr:metal ABC transporter permease [Candidatus Uhrbacteria bacterium]